MNTKLTLSILLIMMTTFLVAQNTLKNPPLTPEYGEDFQYVSFTIYGLESESEAQNLINNLSSNENLKQVEISSHYQFSAYVQKDYKAKLNYFFKDKGYRTSMRTHHSLRVEEGSRVVEIPEGMKPVYKDTGHPEEDKARYTEAKRQLLLEHPEFIKQ